MFGQIEKVCRWLAVSRLGLWAISRFRSIGGWLAQTRLGRWCLGTCLGRYVYRHRQRLGKAVAVGLSLFSIGFGLLTILVSVVEFHKGLSNLSLGIAMTAFGFFVNRGLAWPERDTKTNVGLTKYYLKAIVFGATSQSAFYIFAVVLSQHYLAVKVGIALALGLPSFAINETEIFKRRKI